MARILGKCFQSEGKYFDGGKWQYGFYCNKFFKNVSIHSMFWSYYIQATKSGVGTIGLIQTFLLACLCLPMFWSSRKQTNKKQMTCHLFFLLVYFFRYQHHVSLLFSPSLIGIKKKESFHAFVDRARKGLSSSIAKMWERGSNEKRKLVVGCCSRLIYACTLPLRKGSIMLGSALRTTVAMLRARREKLPLFVLLNPGLKD